MFPACRDIMKGQTGRILQFSPCFAPVRNPAPTGPDHYFFLQTCYLRTSKTSERSCPDPCLPERYATVPGFGGDGVPIGTGDLFQHGVALLQRFLSLTVFVYPFELIV
jgi:hypothetical protein